MPKGLTNNDKILQAVLSNPRLARYGEYDPDEFVSVSKALLSDNPIVYAVAKIIEEKGNEATDREIYNEVSNYLKQNLL